MPIVIDDPATEALARDLARREGVTPAELIARALAERGDATRAPEPQTQDLEARRGAIVRLAALQADIERRYPNEAEPLPWETLKSWAEDGDGAGRAAG